MIHFWWSAVVPSLMMEKLERHHRKGDCWHRHHWFDYKLRIRFLCHLISVPHTNMALQLVCVLFHYSRRTSKARGMHQWKNQIDFFRCEYVRRACKTPFQHTSKSASILFNKNQTTIFSTSNFNFRMKTKCTHLKTSNENKFGIMKLKYDAINSNQMNSVRYGFYANAFIIIT